MVEGGDLWLTRDHRPPARLGSGRAGRHLAHEQRWLYEEHGWLIETLGVWRTANGGLDWKQVLSTLDQRVNGQPVFGTFESPTAAIYRASWLRSNS